MEEHMFQGTMAVLNQLVKSVENWSYDWAGCKFLKKTGNFWEL